MTKSYLVRVRLLRNNLRVSFAHLGLDFPSKPFRVVGYLFARQVRRHDEDGVSVNVKRTRRHDLLLAEEDYKNRRIWQATVQLVYLLALNRSPLPVGQPTLVEQLQENLYIQKAHCAHVSLSSDYASPEFRTHCEKSQLEINGARETSMPYRQHVRVSFVNLVEEYHGVRVLGQTLRQITAVVVPDIPCKYNENVTFRFRSQIPDKIRGKEFNGEKEERRRTHMETQCVAVDVYVTFN